jgi:hypothetical protein
MRASALVSFAPIKAQNSKPSVKTAHDRAIDRGETGRQIHASICKLEER